MAEFVVLNGIQCPALHREVERLAFLQGVVSRDLYEYMQAGWGSGEQALFFCVDRDCLEEIPGQLLNILFMVCPTVYLPVSREELEEAEAEARAGFPLEPIFFPLERRGFEELCRRYAGEDGWGRRTMVFGGLRIDRGRREVSVEGEIVPLRGYDYEILVMLAEHMGDVVPREWINGGLPGRKRRSMRNVDTHIKRIRRELGEAGAIECVRSVGYCMKMPLPNGFI